MPGPLVQAGADFDADSLARRINSLESFAQSPLVVAGGSVFGSRFTAYRPKVASIGNSINARNQFGETAAGYWSAWSYLNWIYALSQGGFDYATSTPATWTTNPITAGANASGQNESIDAYGNYGAPGAKSSQILLRLPQIMAAYTITPDVFYLSSMLENDISGGDTPATMQANITKIIELITLKFPQSLIVLSTPGPSDNYTINGKVANYVAMRTWVQQFNEPRVVIERNDALMADVNTGTASPRYFSDFYNTAGFPGNVHQNEAGAVKRAKNFLTQFPTLFSSKRLVPSASSSDIPGNIAGIVGAAFQINPALNRTGAPGQTLSGLQITGFDYYTDTNITPSIQANPSGLQMSLTGTGAISGLGNGSSFTSDGAGVVSLSNVLAGTFQGHALVKIINPTNLATLRWNLQFSNSGASPVVWGTWTQGLFAEGLSQVLSAGDLILMSTGLITLGANNQLDYMQIKPTMMPQSGPAAGPKVELQRMNMIRVA